MGIVFNLYLLQPAHVDKNSVNHVEPNWNMYEP